MKTSPAAAPLPTPRSLRLKQQWKEVARAAGVRVDRCRLWGCGSRENETCRPEYVEQGPFSDHDTVRTVSVESSGDKMRL